MQNFIEVTVTDHDSFNTQQDNYFAVCYCNNYLINVSIFSESNTVLIDVIEREYVFDVSWNGNLFHASFLPDFTIQNDDGIDFYFAIFEWIHQEKDVSLIDYVIKDKHRLLT